MPKGCSPSSNWLCPAPSSSFKDMLLRVVSLPGVLVSFLVRLREPLRQPYILTRGRRPTMAPAFVQHISHNRMRDHVSGRQRACAIWEESLCHELTSRRAASGKIANRPGLDGVLWLARRASGSTRTGCGSSCRTGRTLGVPLARFPRLLKATREEREACRISRRGCIGRRRTRTSRWPGCLPGMATAPGVCRQRRNKARPRYTVASQRPGTS